jgi:hypothetical protein
VTFAKYRNIDDLKRAQFFQSYQIPGNDFDPESFLMTVNLKFFTPLQPQAGLESIFRIWNPPPKPMFFSIYLISWCQVCVQFHSEPINQLPEM